MDIDGGWSKTPHAITNAMPQMTMPELACTMLLVRETYGWHRPRARLTYGDFTRLTNVKSKSSVAEALNLVETRGFFRRTGERSVWAIGETEIVDGAAHAYAGQEFGSEAEARAAHDAGDGPDCAALADEEGPADELWQQVAGMQRKVAELQRTVDELAGTRSERNDPAREAEYLLAEVRRVTGALSGANSELEGSAWEAAGPQFEPNASAWEVGGTEIEPGGSAWEREHTGNEPNGSAGRSDGTEVEPDGSACGSEGTDIELDGSIWEAEGTDFEPDGSVRATEGTGNEPDGSVLAVAGSEIGTIDAIFEEFMGGNSPANGLKNEPNGSIGGYTAAANGSFPGSLPLYKDKGSPSGIKREGERKEIAPPARAPTAGPVLDQGRQEVQEAGQKRDAAGSAQGIARCSKHTTPRPRSKKQMLLASHPAASAWLEVGLEWPGWGRMKVITGRMGRQPQVESLRQARQMWLMAGYRMDNVDGILDWYEELCEDEGWRPYGRKMGENW